MDDQNQVVDPNAVASVPNALNPSYVPDPTDPANQRQAIQNFGQTPQYATGMGGPVDIAATMDANQVPYNVTAGPGGEPQVVPVAAQAAATPPQPSSQYASAPQTPAQAPMPSMADVQLPAEAKAALNQYPVQQKANEAIANAEADKAAADSAAFKNSMADTALRQDGLQKLHDNFEKDFGQKMADLDGLSNQLAQQNPHIDANNFWNTRTTGQRILGGIALALGAAGASLTGGPNYAMDIINKAIDRDIQSQKFNAEQKSDNLKNQIIAKQNVLGQLRNKFSDDQSFELAQKAMAFDKVQQQLNLNASTSQNPIIKQRAVQLNSAIEQQKQNTILQLKQTMYHQQILQKYLGESDPTKIPAQAMSMLSPDDRKLIDDRRERWVPGWGEATTKEGAAKFRDSSAEGVTVLNNIQQINSLSKKLNALSPVTDREEVEGIRTRLAALVGPVNKVMNKTNRLSEVDLKQAEKILGDPTANLSLKSIQLKKLNTAAKLLQDDLNNQATANGVQTNHFTDFDQDPNQYFKPLPKNN